MERSDARMTTLLQTTEEMHRSMTLRAEEAERHIKQFAEKLEGLEQRGLPGERNHAGTMEVSDNILVAGRANEDVDMNSADQIAGNRGTRRQPEDGNEADEETDPEDQVKKDEMNLKLELMTE